MADIQIKKLTGLYGRKNFAKQFCRFDEQEKLQISHLLDSSYNKV